ncbi:uncharacterized protein LOC110993437 [Pieris rapae]|uniref:uncharacterized protein LOC110993437 n=1 Tax=Pieris rapae TaxID=64459 RepID=UPI001E27FB5C|nr:uncharacterized protein LOC110993437 [Pieris rapae]XP_022115396.2 uncharacterized protein LOC110993437 [Pieris rapae]
MGVKWRLKCRIWAVLAIIQVVYGHEMYTISQLSPKSAHNEKSPQDVLRTEPENLAFRIEPSVKLEEDLTPVEASRNPRSINTDEIALNNNEIDNEVVHNKRKYYDITPTKTIDYYKDDAAILLSSGFGDKLDFKFPGEAKRAPKGRALTPSEPKVRATVQPILREEGRQNTEIQNIITGIVKLLNGNVNVQANSQLLNGRPRPMASRINNRGPPRISEVPLPEFDTVTHSFVPTKTPPPYPFERPPVEQIPPRPFHRPIPPWQRRPRPPNRRPNPGLPIYKPPILEEKPDIENIIPIEFTTEKNVTDTTTEFTTAKTIEKSTEALIEKTTEVLETTSKKAIEVTEATTVKATTEKPKEIINLTENTDKDEVLDKNDVTDKKEVTNKKVVTDKKELSGKKEVSDKIEVTDIKEVSDKKEMSDKNDVTDKEVKHDFDVIQPSITEVSVEATSTTSTEALGGTTLGVTTKTDAVIEKTSINTQPIATSQGIPYQPYRPRPGIVLDDTDFKPHGTRHRDAPVITAPEHLPGYGEIFDVTVSAIQGPGEKGSVHIENINIHNDDIIVSPSGEQGFVSIDGKRTYLNLFDTSTSISPTRVQEQQTVTVPPQTATPLGTGVAVPADDVQAPIRRPVHRPQTFRRPQPTVRIDTCIVGDDSTCDQAQNEKCRTEAGISSCQCRPGYARRIHRDPCRRVVSLLMDLRVDRLYDRKVTWDIKLMDKDSEPYQQLSYEAVRAIDSAFSMTPFSDDFVSGSVNAIHKGEENQVFVNYTILMQETGETLRSAVATDIQKHILGVIRRRSNNVGTSALWVDSPAGSVLPLKDVDECSSPELNDCHKLASCTNTWGAFKCTCPETTLDPAVTITRSGRDCRECSSSHCNERGVCRYNNGQPYCSCSSGYYGSSCEVDGEVVGVAVGASLAAALVIALTLAALTAWSRKWSREQKAMGMGSPVFNYMTANTVKTPPVGQPPYQVTLEERMRWAQIAEAMAQANHYAQPDPVQMATRPSSAMFGYPTLPPVPLPRMGLHGTMNTVNSRINSASHHNLYGYTNHMASESSSDASSHVQDRADLLVPRPKSRARSMHNQTGIYYDVDYENAPEPIYGSKGIPLSTYTVSRGPPFYR